MKKRKIILGVTFAILLSVLPGYSDIVEKADAYRVEDIGMNILYKNNIDKRIIFGLTYLKDYTIYPISTDTSLYKDYNLHNNREVTISVNEYQKLTSDDEVAALIAHNIAQGVHSYTGIMNGQLMVTKNGAFPFNYWAKKNELEFDKQAVNYMVNAGYNPVALITAYSKTLPEVRGTFWSRHNKANKRMNIIYNYIRVNYPQYLNSNKFTNSVYFKRFVSAL